MSDLAGPAAPWADPARPRTPSPGRGGRFEDGGSRRSPPPVTDRWPSAAANGQPGGTTSSYRNRSPDFARKRRRDESPPNSRDRYIPNYDHRANYGPRYGPGPDMFEDPYRRGGGGPGNGYWDDRFAGSPDRAMPGNGRGPPRSQMPPPSELPHQVTFRYFADYMRSTSPHIAEDKEKLAEQWKRYRQDFSRKQLVGFFEENKNKPWFREKYQPDNELEELRQRLKKKGREGKVAKFVKGLEAGEFDIVNYDYLPSSKKFSPTKMVVPAPTETDPTATNGENGHGAEASEPIKSEPHSSPAIPDPTASPNITNHSLATDEPAIKPESPAAIPPTIEENVKVEEEGVVKKEEATLLEAVEMMEDLEDPQPEFEIGTDALGSSGALGKLIGESMRGKGGSDDIVMIPPAENQLFIKSISPDISRAELENHCKQAEGFDYLALSDPHTGKKLHRVGWVSFLPGTDMKAAEEKLSESRINNFTLHMMRAERPAFQKLRVTPGIMNSPGRITRDLTQARKLAVIFEQEYYNTGGGEEHEKRGSVAIEDRVRITTNTSEMGEEKAEGEEEEDSKPISNEKKTLDLYLYYLRTVFNACYYCACVCDFQEELLRRCAKHVRRPCCSIEGDRRVGLGNQPKASETSWAKTLDERLNLLLDMTEVDPRDFGGEKIDDEVRRLCQPQITDEGAGKFRCKNCSKLFKAMNFIEKHIISKHGEVINQDSIERIKYLNNYILDPSHTTPQPPPQPEYAHQRSNHNGIGGLGHNGIGAQGGMGPGGGGGGPNGMMNMGGGGPGGVGMGGGPGPEFPLGYGPGMPMVGPMGPGPFPGYGPPPQMFAHAYGAYGGMPMFGGPPMMGQPGPGYGHAPPYYMGPAGGYAYPHPQVYPPSAAMGPMTPIQQPLRNHHSRRLGDRISRQFAGGDEMSISSGVGIGGGGDVSKRIRREPLIGGGGSIIDQQHEIVSSDPRSKTVLAYNDLDVTAGEEIVLNY